MEWLIKAEQLLLSLSILIVLHELGHFIPAKLFKTRVEKFYLFFDPWFSLFKVKKGETEYGIGWLPLGGYVKIAGMIDESMDKEQMKQPAQPWEFRSKPAWQRLIIMVGGVTVNIILGFFIYSMILFAWGEKVLPMNNLKDGIWCVDSVAIKMGFQNGDKIAAINGKPVARYEDMMGEMIYATQVTVMRGGESLTIPIPANFIEQLIDNKSKQIMAPRIPAMVAQAPDTSNAYKAGLRNKDKIIALNDRVINYFDELKEALQQAKGTTVTVKVMRDGKEIEFSAPVSADGRLGFVPALFSYDEMEKMGLYTFETVDYGFFASFPAGFSKTGEKLSAYVRQFKLILNPSTGAYKGLGGFGSIANMFPPEWNWHAFWEMTALLSIILAFMNILPIPALDGGHVMFLFYELITGRKPNEKALEYAQYAGMILLLTLLIFANGNDIIRSFFSK